MLEAAIKKEEYLKKRTSRSTKLCLFSMPIITVAELIAIDALSLGFIGWLIFLALDIILFRFLPYIMVLLAGRAKTPEEFADYRDSFAFIKKYRNHNLISIEVYENVEKCDWAKYIDSMLAGEKRSSNRYRLLSAKQVYLELCCRADESAAVLDEMEKCVPKYYADNLVLRRMAFLGGKDDKAGYMELYRASGDVIGRLTVKALSSLAAAMAAVSQSEFFGGNYEKALEIRKMSLEAITAYNKQSGMLKKFPNFVLIEEIENSLDLAEIYAAMGEIERAVSGMELIGEKVDALTTALSKFHVERIARVHRIIEKKQAESSAV